jgi:hypothetical protein
MEIRVTNLLTALKSTSFITDIFTKIYFLDKIYKELYIEIN